MSHSGPGSGGPVDVVPDGADKLDEGLGGLRHAVVGPHRVVELPHQPGVVQLVLLRAVTSIMLRPRLLTAVTLELLLLYSTVTHITLVL